jgi:hypothetical protein
MSAAVSLWALSAGLWVPVLAEAETVWPSAAVPTVASASDTNAVELGVKFRTTVDGLVTGVRFYKGSANTSTHIGSLWSSSGTRLAQATFVNETASGWQQANFGTPVAVAANTVYVVSYFTPGGRYSYDRNYFTAGGISAGSLYLLRHGENGGNGVYAYGSASSFPVNTYQASNYWVDLVFEPGTSTPPPPPPPRDCSANPVVAENCLPGNPSTEWEVSGAGDPTIQGFATSISVNRGETVHFKVDTDASSYRLDIYRLGYYDGLGARRVATVQPSASLPQPQPNCLQDSSTGLIDCGNWGNSASWAVPVDAVSGVYIARLVRADTGGASHIPFIVRDDSGLADILFKTADTTWQAYNSYGGNSLYQGQPAGRAYKVSYNRPFNTRGVKADSYLFNAEYPMIRWLEANGYHVSYTSGVDADRRGALLFGHRVFMSNGHDEYWSAVERANVEAARDAGVHLAFFSGNEVFWKTRWEESIDGSGTPYRTLVCYKETHANAKIDPDPAWTGTWRDPRFSPPSDGGRPENALTGTIFKVNSGGTASIVVPAADGRTRFWRNTSVAALPDGTSATMPFGTLGYEWDEDADNGFRPPGLVRLSTTVVGNVPVLQDYGSSYAPGTASHSLTLYRTPSGALVFGAGTIQWAWGLDSIHDRGSASADARMQQATVNLLADMGVQPGTLQGGLVAALASTDAVPPTSVVSTPAAGSNLPVGSPVTVSGSASDTGGGVVGGVEVSLDGGATWRRANGRTAWSYSWTPSSVGQARLRSRAADDSGNVESPGTGVLVTVTAPANVPPVVTNPGAQTGTVGVAITPLQVVATDGNGDALNYGASGLPAGLGINASTGLITGTPTTAGTSSVTVTANDGRGGTGSAAFSWTINAAPPPANVPPVVTNPGLQTGTVGEAVVPLQIVATDDNGDALSYSATGLPAGLGINGTTGLITGTPTTAGTSSVTVTADDGRGGTASAAFQWTINAPGTCPCSVWGPADVPAVPASTDNRSVELGVKFRSSVNGYVTGIRFYKGAGNSGTHTGSLWNSSGVRLATATFTNESASGWQQVSFATPVPIVANTVYVASYFAPQGRYSYSRPYFSTAGITRGSLYLLRDGESGGNGVYAYGATSSFPGNTYQSTNYWIDVVFE